jgi:hypothetical protein
LCFHESIFTVVSSYSRWLSAAAGGTSAFTHPFSDFASI